MNNPLMKLPPLHQFRQWGGWLGLIIAVAAAYWLLRGFNVGLFASLVGRANVTYLVLVPVSIVAEQWLRAWKWSQILSVQRRTPVRWAFSATMAGYVPGLVVGLGTSAITRAWLLARRMRLATSSVLASTAVDRLIDLFVFAAFAALAGALTVLPSAPSALTQALRWSGAILFVVAVIVLALLTGYRREKIPRRLAGTPRGRSMKAVRRALRGFSQGIDWPKPLPRRALIVTTAVAIKLLAVSQYLWAGLAIGARLAPADYLFIMVALGTLVVTGFFIRVPGSGILASIFVLEILGLARERALGMTIIVTGAFLLVIALVGGAALWWEGVSLSQLRTLPVNGDRF